MCMPSRLAGSGSNQSRRVMTTHQQPAGQCPVQNAAHAGSIRHGRRGPRSRRRRSIHWIGGHAAQHPSQEGAAGGVTRGRHGTQAGTAGVQDASAVAQGEGAGEDGSAPQFALPVTDIQAVPCKAWSRLPCCQRRRQRRRGADEARCAGSKRSGERSRTFAVPGASVGGGGAAARPCACRGDPSIQETSLPCRQLSVNLDLRSDQRLASVKTGCSQGCARACLLPVPSTAATTTLLGMCNPSAILKLYVQQRLLLHSSKKGGRGAQQC